MANCSALQDLSDFTSYAAILDKETSFDASRLELCRIEICTAVYGTGNPDISGIGVTVGYILEVALGIFLALCVLLFKDRVNEHARRAHEIFRSGLAVFFDSAAYFTIAIQLATIVVLVQKDFGISTDDFGAIETQIAQALSVVCILPLLYPVALLEGSDGQARQNARLFLLNAVIALSFYPFLSRCLRSFDKADAPIGSGPGADVDTKNWTAVESVCFRDGLAVLKNSGTYRAMEELELATTLMIYLFAIWLLVGILDPHFPRHNNPDEARKPQLVMSFRERVNGWFGRRRLVSIFGLLGILGLAVPLIWIMYLLRTLQRELGESTQAGYQGDSWGFGQIVSIVLFAPIPVEMVYRWRFGHEFRTLGQRTFRPGEAIELTEQKPS